MNVSRHRIGETSGEHFTDNYKVVNLIMYYPLKSTLKPGVTTMSGLYALAIINDMFRDNVWCPITHEISSRALYAWSSICIDLRIYLFIRYRFQTTVSPPLFAKTGALGSMSLLALACTSPAFILCIDVKIADQRNETFI